jgi:hypothetical protein
MSDNEGAQPSQPQEGSSDREADGKEPDADLVPDLGRLRKFIKLGQAVAIAAVAAYGALRPTGGTEAAGGYQEMAGLVRDLQAYTKANDKDLAALRNYIKEGLQHVSEASASDVNSIRLYMTGYLMGLARAAGSTDRRQVDEALAQLLKQAAEGKAGVGPGIGGKANGEPLALPKPAQRPQLKAPAIDLDAAAKKYSVEQQVHQGPVGK